MQKKLLASGALAAVAIAAIFVAVFWPHLVAHPSTPSATHAVTALTVPQPLEPGNGVTVDDTAITFQWSAVAGAHQYRLAIQVCNHAETCTDANTTNLPDQTSATARVTSTQLSAYLDVNVRWRVWAVDANQKSGPPSPWQIFRAVKVLH